MNQMPLPDPVATAEALLRAARAKFKRQADALEITRAEVQGAEAYLQHVRTPAKPAGK